MATKSFTPTHLSMRAIFEQEYKDLRKSLFWIIMFTVMNVSLAFFAADAIILSSAMIPYLLVWFPMYYCGLYPSEYYEEGVTILRWPPEVLIVTTIIAVVIIGLYVLSFVLSKNGKGGWLTFALVLFSIDTLVFFLFYGFHPSALINWIFHIGWLVTLGRGANVYKVLKSLPPITSVPRAEYALENETIESSMPIRIADMGARCRVFHDTVANGKQIVYRKVGKTKELLINGYVYDEYKSFLPRKHMLSATINGHVIEAGSFSGNRTFVAADGVIVATKIRIL